MPRPIANNGSTESATELRGGRSVPSQGGLQDWIASTLVLLALDPEPVAYVSTPYTMTRSPIMGRARCLRSVFDNALRHGRDCARHPVAFMPNPVVSLPAPAPAHPVPPRRRRAPRSSMMTRHHALLETNQRWPWMSLRSHDASRQTEYRQPHLQAHRANRKASAR